MSDGQGTEEDIVLRNLHNREEVYAGVRRWYQNIDGDDKKLGEAFPSPVHSK